MLSNKYKTQLCKNYLNCPYGHKCMFAHNPQEINNNNTKYKTQLCKNYLNCPYGQKCMFAHNPQEVRAVTNPINNITPKIISEKTYTNITKYKTQMCKNPETCTFKEKCRYAHSSQELRKQDCETPYEKFIIKIEDDDEEEEEVVEVEEEIIEQTNVKKDEDDEELRAMERVMIESRIYANYASSNGCNSALLDKVLKHIENMHIK